MYVSLLLGAHVYEFMNGNSIYTTTFWLVICDIVLSFCRVCSVQENYALVRAKYGEGSCCLLQINSCPPSPSSQLRAGPDIWAPHMRTANGGGLGGGGEVSVLENLCIVTC